MSALDYKVKLNDGNEIPALGLGAGGPDEETYKKVIQFGVRNGIRHFDTAWYYGTEHVLGAALKELFDAGEVKREDIFITTKVWPSLWDKVEYSLDESLKNLGLYYVDLFLQHWPVTYKKSEKGIPANPYVDGVLQFDKDGDYLDTWKQIINIQKTTNKVRSIGVSNYNIPQLQRIIDETGVVPVVNQIELHPKLPSKKLVEFGESKGVKFIAYSPTGSSGAPLIKEVKVQELAKRHNTSENVILTSYHILSGRIVIPRSSNLDRVKGFTEVVQLSKEELAELDQIGIDNPTRYIQDDWGVGLGFEHWKTKFSWEK